MFHFKQFSIDDSRCAMKVGTDAVLLGAIADIANAKLVLDIGCGSGILSLMAAQRNKNCQVTAIELDKEACLDAQCNFDASPWKTQISLLNQRFQDFTVNCELKFDTILCNPPFFSNSLRALGSTRSMARHDDNLPFDELLKGIKRVLNPKGKCTLIIPFDSQQKWLIEANLHGLYVTNISLVKSYSHMKPHRSIIELSPLTPTMALTTEIVIYSEKGVYSQSYKDICKEFYLNF